MITYETYGLKLIIKIKTTRRTFIENGLKAGAVISLASTGLMGCASPSENQDSEQKKLKILILGGTSFLGPHQVAYAIERGHSVTTFTRGKTMPTVHQELFDKVEMLIGDRETDLEALKNRTWDAVIDNSGRQVKWTEDTAALLEDKVELYLYTSSTGVYFPYLDDDIHEDQELVYETPANADTYSKYEYDYGVMKANSELMVKQHFGHKRSILVRPTYMVGPADKLDRFIHWPIRLSRGGNILVPGMEDDPVQFIDVRDVAHFMIRLLESNTTGTFNAVGPKNTTGMLDFVNKASEAFDVDKQFIVVDDYEFLKSQKLQDLIPWIMPEGMNFGSARINRQLAIENGLTFTPLGTTVKDTYDWWYSNALTEARRQKYEANPDIILNREEDIIKNWQLRESVMKI